MAARLFVPHQALEICPDCNAINSFTPFPFFDSDTISHVKDELSDYIAKAADVSAETDTLEWW